MYGLFYNKVMSDATTAELAESIKQELIKSGKILSDDFARAFEEKNKQKILEIIIEHFIHHTQFIMSIHDTANRIDDEKLEAMKRQLFDMFVNVSK